MRIRKALPILALAGIPLFGLAQSPMMGQYFWLGFLPNAHVQETPQIVSISALVPATGSVSWPGGEWTVPFEVVPGVSTEVEVPWQATPNVSGEVEGKGLLVEADAPVSVQAMSLLVATLGSAAILPQERIGMEYRALSYPALPGWTGIFASELLIVATEDGTSVEVTPSCAMRGGLQAGEIDTVQLDQGESLLLQGMGDSDVSGTRIRSLGPDVCRPLAVFCGASTAEVPSDCQAGDHLFDQMVPTAGWRRSYQAAPFAGLGTYTCRVMAAKDGTTVAVDGEVAQTLSAGGLLELQHLADPICIQADKPIAVAQYMEGAQCSGMGDPALVLLPGEDMPPGAIVFEAFDLGQSNGQQRFITVVVDAQGVDSLFLDGVPVPASAFTPFPSCSDRAWCALPVAIGVHELQARVPYRAVVHGFDQLSGHAYPLGCGTVLLSDSLIVSDGSPLVLTAPDGMVAPVWTVSGAPEELLGTGPSLDWTPEDDVTILVSEGGAGPCTMRMAYSIVLMRPIIEWNGEHLFVEEEGDTYQWSFAGTPIPGANTDVHVPLANGEYTVTLTRFEGFSATSPPYLFVVTGIAGPAAAACTIVPRPAGDRVTVGGLPADASLRCFDVQGRLVWRMDRAGAGSIDMDVSAWSPGRYTLEVRSATRTERLPLIKR